MKGLFILFFVCFCKISKISLFIQKYVKMSAKLAETKGELGAFKDIVEPLGDEHSERLVN